MKMPSSKTSKPSPDGRKPLGDFGERVAAAHLLAKGYEVIDRKFRVFEAEIDVVARDGDQLVFVEVRTRRGGAPGMAALSVSRTKARRLRHAVEWYVERHPELADAPLRIDVIAVELDRDGTLREVTHIEDAVRG
jgi:putative endonuclease